MKHGAIVAALIGVALAVYVILHIGPGAVIDAILSVGWGGFAIIYLYGFVTIAVLGVAWYLLVPSDERLPVGAFVIARQIRDSAGDILPFSQIGGIVIGARAIILRGMSPSTAFGATIADVTTELMAQLVFIAAGIALCITELRASPLFGPYTNEIIAGVMLLVPGAAAFIVIQQKGSTIAGRLATRFLPAAVAHTEAIGAATNKIYGSPARIVASSICHLVGWISSGAATWISFHFLGAHIDLLSAIAIESLLAALKSAMVFVPAAVGVQEVGYAALAPLFGLPPDMGIAVSLLRRARDVTIGIPVLLLWQAMEGKRLFARSERQFSEP